MSGKVASTTGSAVRSTAARRTTTTVAVTYKDGDTLLRAGEEAWIMELTGGRFSHAGICTKGNTNEAADAHPVDSHRKKGNEVATLPISDFFSKAHAPGGGEVYRYTGGKPQAEAAARWAEGECGKPYYFDIMDPITGSRGTVQHNNRLYCSEFVWRCYRSGAGVTLVDPNDFINLLDKSAY